MSTRSVAVRNAADPEQVGRAQKRGDVLREQELADVRGILSTTGGRRFYYRLIKKSGVYAKGPPASAEDAFFREGRRDIGMLLIEEMNLVDAQAWFRMVAESESETPKEDPNV